MNFGFNFGLYGGARINYPPVSEDLLVWLKGNNDGTDLKLDSLLKPDAENWAMSGAHCASLNGTDEFGAVGVISSEDIEMMVSFVVGAVGATRVVIGRFYQQDNISVGAGGTIDVRVNNESFPALKDVVEGEVVNVYVHYDLARVLVEINGIEVVNEPQTGDVLNNDKAWEIGSYGNGGNYFNSRIFNSTINGKHFGIAEGAGLVSFADSYLTDGVHVKWTADVGTLWTQRQDVYFRNAIEGFGYSINIFQYSRALDEWEQTGCTVSRFNSESTLHVVTNGGFISQHVDQTYAANDYNRTPRSLTSEFREILVPLFDQNGKEWWIVCSAKLGTTEADTVFGVALNEHDTNTAQFEYVLSTDNGEAVVKESVLSVADRVSMTQPSKIVVAGDSIADISGSPMAALFTDSVVVQSGVGGDDIRMLIDRFDADVAAHNPDYVFLIVGHNDLTTSGDSLDQMKSDTLELLALCTGIGALVVASNISPIGEKAGWTQAMQDVLEAYNAWLPSVCTAVDSYNYMLEPGTIDFIHNGTSDGVHPASSKGSDTYIPMLFGYQMGLSLPSHGPTADFTLDGTEKLPYLNDNPGGTFNDCEVSYGPEEGFVGTFNGTDTTISLGIVSDENGIEFGASFVVGALGTDRNVLGRYYTQDTIYVSSTGNLRCKVNSVQHDIKLGTLEGEYYVVNVVYDLATVVVTLNGVEVINIAQTGAVLNNSRDWFIGNHGNNAQYFNSTARNVNINGIKIPLDEGEGTDIHDSDGNVVGTLNDDPAAFYGGQKMVSDAVIAMEAASDTPVYTDGLGHAVASTQQEWEASTEINYNKQYYLTKCEGKNVEAWDYKTPRSDTEDFEILVASCNAEGVGVNGVQVGVNDVPIGERI